MPLSEPAESLADVNDALTRETVRIYMDATQQRASRVSVTRDSIYYVEGMVPRYTSLSPSDSPLVQRHISSVDSIGVEYGAGGGRTGAFVGASPGLLTGAFLGVSVANNCTPNGGWNSCGLGAAVTGLYTLVVAGGGALIGALIGNSIDEDAQTVYRAPVSRYLNQGSNAAMMVDPRQEE